MRHMAAYQHSELFALLKKVEDYPYNFTSYQWLTTLDFFIESAIDPIVATDTEFADAYYAKVVAWAAHKPNTKFTRGDVDLPTVLWNAQTSKSLKTKRDLYRSMNLNRGLLLGLIRLYLERYKQVMAVHDPWASVKERKRLLAYLRDQHPQTVPALAQVQFWYDHALNLKNIITNKFMRMTLNQARRTYVDYNHVLRLNEVIQIYLKFLNKAIERCDAQQGVLTSFIQNWLMSARGAVAVQVKAAQSQISYEDYQLDRESLGIGEDTKEEDLQFVAATAKELEPDGLIRFSLAIPEFLTSAQRKVLVNHFRS